MPAILESLISAGATFCQAQNPAATLAFESRTGMVTLALVDYNRPITPPQSSTPSTGGAIRQSGLMRGFVTPP
jgi:hypothetical protein